MRIPPTTPWLHTIAIALCAALGGVSCQSLPEGYWTKQDSSQALTNQQYPADSQQCEELVARDGSGKSEAYKAGLFTRCMQANGYQWIAEQPRSHPVKTALEPSPHPLVCSTGRLITDVFGYPRCVPAGTKDGGVPPETILQVPHQVPPDDLTDHPVLQPTPQPVAGRAMDDGACRQYAKESLSSTYGVYTQCMQDKGWGPRPGP